MSELGEKENEGSCQKKLAAPRSLRDGGERAQIVWDMIAKRYPKAAPLLYEMETAIDRAETLLHQLRRVPGDMDDPPKIRASPSPSRKSNLTAMSCSEEFERQCSSSSVMDSSSTCEEINEEVEEVGTRISYDRIPEMEDPSGSGSSASVEEPEQRESIDSTSHPVESDHSRNAEDSQAEKRSQKCESHDRSDATSRKEREDTARTKEAESLEGWDRVVGGDMVDSRRARAKRQIFPRLDRFVSHDNSTVRQATKPEVPSPEASARIHGEKSTGATIAGATTREIDSSSTKRNRHRNETALSPQRRTRKTFDSSPTRDATSSIESPSSRTEMEKINDRHNLKNHGTRKRSPKNPNATKTPAEILEDYAAQNNKRVKFEVLQVKANACEIECSFAGYVAKRIGSSTITVKNEVAAIILRMLAEKQMDEQDMKNLEHFSDDQMRDIVALGTEGKPENAMRKLYKCCLEKNAPKPLYTVKGSNEVDGFKHFAECRALGKVGEGSGIRDESAKISAAEELYTKLRLEHSSP